MTRGGFSAPQFGMHTKHERIMAQSAYDDEIKGTLKWIHDHPLVVSMCVVAIGTTTFTLW